MKKTWITIVLITLMGLGAGVALAGGYGNGHHGRGMFRGHGLAMMAMGRALCRLNLSDEQQQKVHAIIEAARPEIEAHIQALRKGREQLQAMAPGQFDEATVQAIAQKQAAQMAALIVLKQKVRSQIYNVLTPKQQKQADEMRHERQKERRCMRGMFGGGTGPGGPGAHAGGRWMHEPSNH